MGLSFSYDYNIFSDTKHLICNLEIDNDYKSAIVNITTTQHTYNQAFYRPQ